MKKLLILSAVIACSNPTAPTVDYGQYAGVYNLQSISNVSLPWVRNNADGTIDKILSSTETLTSNGNYTYIITSSVTDKLGKVTVNVGNLYGKFTVEGNVISFYNKGWSGGTYELQFTGLIEGNNLSFRNFQYSK
jgi:hypothetical protein